MEIVLRVKCRTCGNEKPIEEFHKNKECKYGINTKFCASCRSAYYRNRYKNNPERAKANSRKRLYGISQEDYDTLFAEQKGLCAACGQPENIIRYGKVDKLAVDHCHTTGAVRGLLCTRCNRALGLLHDNPEKIKALLKYVEERALW